MQAKANEYTATVHVSRIRDTWESASSTDEPSFVISVYPGTGTNQVAELLALRIAIEIAGPGAVI
jgi:hypothetical protein